MGAPHERLLGAIEVALGEVSLEGLPGRRRVDRPAPAILGAIAGPLETILRDARTGRAAPSYAVAMSTAFTPALGSLLFAYGAPHPTWRRWTAIAAVGEALDGGWCAAVTLGAIAHAWDLVDRVPTVSEGYDASWAALFRLLGKEPAIDPTTARDEPEAIALWAALVEDHARGRDVDRDGTHRAAAHVARKHANSSIALPRCSSTLNHWLLIFTVIAPSPLCTK